MSSSAIVMMAAGCSIVWGGLLLCLRIALKKEQEKAAE